MRGAEDIKRQLEQALAECARLHEENARLKTLLNIQPDETIKLPDHIPAPSRTSDHVIDHSTGALSPEGKIKLFQSLFRGRNDVYALRWESRKGRSGYSPACPREWEMVDDGSYKLKKDLRNREYFPLTDEVVRNHLTGKCTIGIYPLLTDESCWFLAADFDKKTWQDDARAFLETSREMGVPAALERSRSGNGGHVRISVRDVEEIINEALRNSEVIGVRVSMTDEQTDEDPWTMPPSRKRIDKPITEPLPEKVRIVRSNLLYVEKAGLPSAMLNRLIRVAAFQNPEFYRAQGMRLSTFGKPRVIGCAEEFTHHIGLPRGCLDDVLALLKSHNVKADLIDERFPGNQIKVTFRGELRPLQQMAVAAMHP
jgi:hypothetical protein